MAEVIISHITSMEHPVATPIEGAIAASYAPRMQVGPIADGEATPEADVVGVSGVVAFRNITGAQTFLNNAKAGMEVNALQQGQAVTSTFTFANCKALGFTGEFPMGSKDAPVPTVGVVFAADSAVIT